MTQPRLAPTAWTPDRLCGALERLAGSSGNRDRVAAPQRELLTAALSGSLELADRAIASECARLGLECETVSMTREDLETHLHHHAPLIVRVHDEAPPGYAVIEGARWGQIRVACPDGSTRSVSIRDWIARLPVPDRVRREVDQLIERSRIAPRRRAIAAAQLEKERLAGHRCATGWSLHRRSGAPLTTALSEDGVFAHALWSLGFSLLARALSIGGWVVLFDALTDRNLTGSVMFAWVLLVATGEFAQMTAGWFQSHGSVRLGALLRDRMLLGATRLGLDAVRIRGAGHWLGIVLESHGFESHTIGGVFGGALTSVELAAAIAVLLAAPHTTGLAWLLMAWCVASIALHVWRLPRWRAWFRTRQRLSRRMVEGMLGHRTRAMQEAPGAPDHELDAAAERHLRVSGELDRWQVWIAVLAPRGWLVAGFALLLTDASWRETVAGTSWMTVAGLLLGYGALERLTTACSSLSNAAAALDSIRPLLRAARRANRATRPEAPIEPEWLPTGEPVIECVAIGYRHRGRLNEVLRGCSLEIGPGARVSIDGASACGKSTLAGILAGIRIARSGQVRIGGRDARSIPERDRVRHLSLAPQPSENHVFSDTLAFNLLLGRPWPHRAEDYEDARLVCEELGLGSLIRRMPAGLHQQVGEVGWQLSQGESHRVFIARAMLQRSRVVILDEGLGGLDPASRSRCLGMLDRRPEAVVLTSVR
ncbi:MAG: ATP-binding cassette domain-containing protein [Candidatus Eisenbacteria bacterium]|uniref:ATP-binding cassette domain-containing protein n=1 Tax=Eiseniibacteriota bacterium TaxID=2212470 RepID=A0A849SJ03_UNCEI|nr:ATP-binding cassette domain-containing protein [Candidatus Eisenbacteria bacterium]